MSSDIISSAPHDCSELAERLNSGCLCVSLDRLALRRELAGMPDGDALAAMMEVDRPTLFAGSTVFVADAHIERMAQIIAAIERVVALPAYLGHILAYAPETARHIPRARGVFVGYDFHLGSDGPQLIEINSNAGGGLLNALLARAQQACCDAVKALASGRLPGELSADQPEHLFMEMFRSEWRAERGVRTDRPLKSIAIVDQDPESQYLYPEFVLFRQMFARHGISAVICEPAALIWRDGVLSHEDSPMEPIDLVYNRLTDFALEEPGNAALRMAYLSGGTVVTPHPHAHARYADKRNLVALSDAELLGRWGVDAATRSLLVEGIPHTESVAVDNAETLWARRRQLFFKPVAGFGSKAAYRGDKLTRRVFAEIIAGAAAYVAQALVTPTSRRLEVDGVAVDLKLDLRNYVYDGAVQLVAARLWAGQTTNFRTPGGGFAPVLAVPCKDEA